MGGSILPSPAIASTRIHDRPQKGGNFQIGADLQGQRNKKKSKYYDSMVATRNIISQNIMVVVLVKCSNLGGE
jgi:hypothetical protein